MKAISTVVGVILILSTAAWVGSQQAGPSPHKAALSNLPIYFIENRGVYPEEVAYYVQGADKTLYFTKDGLTFLLKGSGRGWVVKLEFVGANPDVLPEGEDRQQAIFSYFKGPKKDWKTGLRTYSTIVYRDLWPGIDLVYRGSVNRLKYDLIVNAGADPRKIRMRYRGANRVEVTHSGGLQVVTPASSFEDAPPLAFQRVHGERVEVPMRYALEPSGRGCAEFGFHLGSYDAGKTLVLDPAMLVYCGYIGGASRDEGEGIAVDAAGYAYLAGTTASDSQTFPVKVGPGPKHQGGYDAFVAKVNPQGTGLVYCGYIGGAASDSGRAIAVDASGSAYVTGETSSDEQTFPVVKGPDLTHNGLADAFVAKVNPQGTGLHYCGYIGGSSGDFGEGIAVDPAGNAYVTGTVTSNEQTFPVTIGPDLTHNGGLYDAFVAKVNPQGSGLLYCGYLGGANIEFGRALAVDSAGNAYLTGETNSNEQTFPVLQGPGLKMNGWMYEGYVAKVNAQGTGLVYCGYIGGAFHDYGRGIAVDLAGHAYVTGETSSTEQTFPVKVGPDLTFSGTPPLSSDAFVAKVGLTGTGFVYCGYIGGLGSDSGNSIAVDATGNAYVTGSTGSDERTFPVTGDLDPTYNGTGDGFAARVNASGTGLDYCGYLGGAGITPEACLGVAVDGPGNAFVTGYTFSDEKTFPVKVGPDLTYNGYFDAFVAKISFVSISGSGTARPGGRVNLTASASNGAGLAFQMGTSLGTGPIPIDTRQLNLSPDNLLLVTVNNYWPTIFAGYRGVIDSKGQAQAAIHIPNIPALIGLRLHSAFVTLDPGAPSGIRSISNTYSFTITK